jgi:hypothetical protein
MKKISIVLLIVVTTMFGMNACASGVFKTVAGNGNVTREIRETGSFNIIKASSGVNVFLFQGEEEKVIVEADENLQECVIIRNEGRTLHCYLDCSIRSSKKLNVYVNYRTLNKINASTGADVFGETVVRTDLLDIDVSSGADVKVEVEADRLKCNVSSGADVVIRGKANSFHANASSGADIKAENLTVNECWANVSSAGEVRVNVVDKLDANASSGGDVRYSGNPPLVNINRSSGGDVKRFN